jgi:hypothetical protein
MKGMYVFLKSRFLPLRRQETPTKSSVILQGEKAKYNFETFLGTSFKCLQCSWYCHSAVDKNLVTMLLNYDIFVRGKVVGDEYL